MKNRNLTKKDIVDAAINLIEENENQVFSLHELAKKLNIKTPSLYNHIENYQDLHQEILKYSIDLLVSNISSRIQGKEHDDAIIEFAKTYRIFANEHKGLYRLIMSMPKTNDKKERLIAESFLSVTVNLLVSYGLTEELAAHWQRIFRTVLHGFISQEDLGYFFHYQNVDVEESWEKTIQCFLDGLHIEISKLSGGKNAKK